MWFVALILIALLVLWELKICEGAHLGRRFVVWLYDLTAQRYEKIKSFDPDWERLFLGNPLAASLSNLHDPRLLDVGAGTGRVPRALLSQPRPGMVIYELEPSSRMLRLGLRLTAGNRTYWTRGWAEDLPFADDTFDAVVCLEVLEFTSRPRRTLVELVRVLRPGSCLLITNRVGWEAPLILGRTFSRRRFPAIVEQAGLVDVQVYPWQEQYDLAWARKPWFEEGMQS